MLGRGEGIMGWCEERRILGRGEGRLGGGGERRRLGRGEGRLGMLWREEDFREGRGEARGGVERGGC